MNPSKVKAYFGNVTENVKQDILRVTSFVEGPLPFKYLRIPLTSKRLNIHYFLDFAGRIKLIKSVLFSNSNF